MIVSGGVDLFNAMAYGQPTQRDMDFFQRSREAIMSSSWGQTAQQFYNNVKQGFDSFSLDKLQTFINVAANKLSSLWEMDTIRPLITIEDMQFAPSKMIRWVMANPVTREFYHDRRCEGYGDKYIDTAPGIRGENHLDYQIVMQGMEHYDKELEANVWTTYSDIGTDDPYHDVNQLTLSEKLDILLTWEYMNAKFEEMGEDPTSQYSAML